MGYSLYGELEIVADDAALAYAALNIDAYANKHAAAVHTRRLSPEKVIDGINSQPVRTGEDNDLVERLLRYGGYTVTVSHNYDGSVGYLARYEGNRWVGFEDTIAYLAVSGLSVYGKILGEEGEAWLYDTPAHTGYLIKHNLLHVPSNTLASLQEDAELLRKIREYARLDDVAEIGTLVKELFPDATES